MNNPQHRSVAVPELLLPILRMTRATCNHYEIWGPLIPFAAILELPDGDDAAIISLQDLLNEGHAASSCPHP